MKKLVNPLVCIIPLVNVISFIQIQRLYEAKGIKDYTITEYLLYFIFFGCLFIAPYGVVFMSRLYLVCLFMITIPIIIYFNLLMIDRLNIIVKRNNLSVDVYKTFKCLLISFCICTLLLMIITYFINNFVINLIISGVILTIPFVMLLSLMYNYGVQTNKVYYSLKNKPQTF